MAGQRNTEKSYTRKGRVLYVTLRCGAVTMIDFYEAHLLEDFPFWSTSNGYVQIARKVPVKSGFRYERLSLARTLVRAPKELQVDHINRNPLDNRRINLRLATCKQNVANRFLRNTTGFRGVHRDSRSLRNPWHAAITDNYKTIYIGLFGSAEAAARAYDKKAKELHGKFAVLNFPTSSET